MATVIITAVLINVAMIAWYAGVHTATMCLVCKHAEARFLVIGARLKLARAAAGLSLRGLEERLEGVVTAQAVGKYERDEMMPELRSSSRAR